MSDTEQLQQRNRELSILNAIAQALNRELDLTNALQAALGQVVELFNLHTGWIWLLREGTDEFYLAVAINLPPALADHPKRMEGWCYCRESYESGDMDGAANVNVIQCTRLKGLVKGTNGLQYHASVPLYAQGRKLGILNVVGDDWRELSNDDLRLLYTVGDLLSIAIERARLFARSTQLGALEERNRLAREIHDTLAQGLAATTLQLETADTLLESGAPPDKVRAFVQRALELTRTNLEETRRSVSDLRAAPLEGRSLLEGLAALTHELSTPGALHIGLDVVNTLPPLPPRIEIGLYRIAQEALLNVVRHAAASEATLQISATPEQVELIVEDNGQGFDLGSIPKGRFGLLGINERARLLGGSAELSSSPGEGMLLRVLIPLVGPA